MSHRRAAPLAAYVLHRYDWSETSLILDLFTREMGRVTVAAKGAKRPYSQLRSVLLPFQRVQVAFGRRPVDEAAEVHTLRSAEWAGDAAMLSGDAWFAGFYLNELLMKLLARHDAHAQLFDAYAATLHALVAADESSAQAALRAFELVLLRETGVLPDLGLVTATQRPVSADGDYELRADAGVMPSVDPAQAIGGATLAQLQSALAEADWTGLRQACAKSLPALRIQLRALIQYHLGHSALRTRQVMVDVRRLLDRADVAAA